MTETEKASTDSLILAPRRIVEHMMASDDRNIRHIARFVSSCDSANVVYRVIADCAQRLFEAREADKHVGGHDLERRAEDNLRKALELRGRI